MVQINTNKKKQNWISDDEKYAQMFRLCCSKTCMKYLSLFCFFPLQPSDELRWILVIPSSLFLIISRPLLIWPPTFYPHISTNRQINCLLTCLTACLGSDVQGKLINKVVHVIHTVDSNLTSLFVFLSMTSKANVASNQSTNKAVCLLFATFWHCRMKKAHPEFLSREKYCKTVQWSKTVI